MNEGGKSQYVRAQMVLDIKSVYKALYSTGVRCYFLEKGICWEQCYEELKGTLCQWTRTCLPLCNAFGQGEHETPTAHILRISSVLSGVITRREHLP